MSVAGKRWLLGALVPVVLVVWWSVLLHQAESSIFARVPMLDEQQYLAEAQYYSDGHLAGSPPGRPFFMSPLYPRLLAVLAVGAEPSDGLIRSVGFFRAVHWFQVLLWLGAVVLLRLTAGRIFSTASAANPWLLWLPSILFIFYRPLAIYTMMVLVEMPLVFLITLLLFFLSAPPRHRLVSGAMGLVLGLAVLLRGSMFVLTPLVLLVLWRSNMPPRERLNHLVLFALTLAIMLAPPMIHNSRLTGHLSGPSLNGGLNLYLGNGPGATGLGTSLPGDWLADPAGTAELARRLQKESVKVTEADLLWRRLATKAMADDPVRVLNLVLKKMHLQTQAWEMDQVTSLNGWRLEVPLLEVLFLPWWAIVIPAVWGLASLVGNTGRNPLRASAGILLSLIFIQSLFFVVSRYRMVLVPVLCLLALAGILEAMRIVRHEGPRGMGRLLPASLAVAGSILLVIPWGLSSARSAWEPLALANYAQRWAVLGAVEQDSFALQRAVEIYETSVEKWPDQSGPYLGYSAVLRELDRPDEADNILQQGIQRVAANLELRRGLLSAHLAANRTKQALDVAQRLLRDYPNDAMTLHNASVLLAGRGQMDEAEAMARRLIRAHPSQAQGYVDLGILLARVGQIDRARDIFQQGLKANPEHPLLTRNLHRLADSR